MKISELKLGDIFSYVYNDSKFIGWVRKKEERYIYVEDVLAMGTLNPDKEFILDAKSKSSLEAIEIIGYLQTPTEYLEENFPSFLI